MARPLLMIPGPIEVSPAVLDACSGPPPSHVSPGIIDDFGVAIARMREVWRSEDDSQPFILSGGGTLSMEVALCNVLEPGDRAVVVHTGYFSARFAEMARRRGATVVVVHAEPGETADLSRVHAALKAAPTKALLITHVDTSTGVRTNPKPLCELARSLGTLSIVDGVCATAGETFEMAAWGADVYLTASQKALGLPPGLALMVASSRAFSARHRLSLQPPMSMDWRQWLPIHAAYEDRRGSYFSTPNTTLIHALRVSLDEIVADGGIHGRIARHQRVADELRGAWSHLGLSLLCVQERNAANTLSAVRYPSGVGPELIGAVKARGVVVAGGLLPDFKAQYFRVGHMGYVTEQPELLRRTVQAIGEALIACGHSCDVVGAVAKITG